MNITTPCNTEARIKEMQDMCFSDFYKDTYGFRPRDAAWEYYEGLSADEFNKDIDYMISKMNEDAIAEAQAQEEAVAAFKQTVQKTIELGAGNEETALRWITQGEVFYNNQCVEHFVWEQGILFTDYGRELVNKLYSIVEYFEEEAA